MSQLGKLLLHKVTKAQANSFLAKPSHALLITGPAGSGKLTLAKTLAAELLGLQSIEKLENHAYFRYLARLEGKQDIPIDAIRQIIRFLRLKTTGSKPIQRVILIENAQDMNEEAQNALLKVLEEPSDDTIFILSAPSAQNLLPTVVSRCQLLESHPLSLESAVKFFEASEKEIEDAWRLSQGGAGLLQALLNDKAEHPLKKSINEAKNFLRQDEYGRLLLGEQIAKDKRRLATFVEALERLLAALHQAAVQNNKPSQQKRLLNNRRLVQRLDEALEANVSPRLIMLELSLNLKL